MDKIEITLVNNAFTPAELTVEIRKFRECNQAYDADHRAWLAEGQPSITRREQSARIQARRVVMFPCPAATL